MRSLLAVLVRTVALALVLAVYYAALPLLFPPTPGDANIGAGLIGFAVLALAAAVGGVLDGRRQPLPRVALTWVAVGVVLGVGWAVALTLVEGPDVALLLNFLATATPSGTVTVAAPAVMGAALGGATRARASGEVGDR